MIDPVDGPLLAWKTLHLILYFLQWKINPGGLPIWIK